MPHSTAIFATPARVHGGLARLALAGIFVLLPLGCIQAPAEFQEAPDTDADDDGYRDEADCDPEDAAISPGADEVCNGVDDDCDGLVDEEDPTLTDGGLVYQDADGDGFGVEDLSTASCSELAPEGWSTAFGDCDDADAAVHPEATEVCSGVDDDCDGLIDDEDDSLVADPVYQDADGDGYGDPESELVSCEPPEDWLAHAGDCDDTNAAAWPGAVELCDGTWTDCDTAWAEDAGMVSTWVEDEDGVRTLTDATATFTEGTAESPLSPALDGVHGVLFCPGTWYLDLELSDRDLDLEGFGIEDTPVLSGGEVGRVLTVVGTGVGEASVSVSDLTVMHGVSDTDGGCVHLSGDAVLDMSGGALRSCLATDSGGAVFADVGSTLSLTEVEISDNSAGSGGGLATQAATTLDAVVATGNVAESGDGGFWYAHCTDQDGSLEVVVSGGTLIEGNSADNGLGGGIYMIGTANNHFVKLYLQGTKQEPIEFTGNTASTGGALYAEERTRTTADHVTFSENSASGSGGALYVGHYWALGTLRDISFSENSATNGGAAAVFNSSDFDFLRTSFEDNEATSLGGALLVDNTKTDVAVGVESRFVGNLAANGGAVALDGNSNTTEDRLGVFLDLDQVSFEGNEATDRGGAIFVRYTATLTMETADFVDNVAAAEGGAIYLEANQTNPLDMTGVELTESGSDAEFLWHTALEAAVELPASGSLSCSPDGCEE